MVARDRHPLAGIGGLGTLVAPTAALAAPVDSTAGWLPWALAGVFAVLAALAAVGWWRQRERLRPLRDVFETLPSPAQVVRSDGRPIRTNAAGRAWLNDAGASLPDLLTAHAQGEVAADALANLHREAASGSGGRAEVAVHWPRCRACWYAVRTYPVAHPPGAAVWFAEDVTSRRDMQERLRTEHERLAGLLDQAPVGFYVVDRDGRFVYANATLADWLERTPSALADGGCRLHHLVDAEAGAPAYSAFPLDPDRDGATETRNAVFHAADGSAFTAHITQQVVREGRDGHPTARAVVRNLSRENAAAAAVAESEQRFRSFFEQAPLGIALLDAAGRIQACNAAFADLLAQQGESLTGERLPELVHASDRKTVADALAGPAGGETDPPEVRSPDGERVFAVFAKAFEATDVGTQRLVYLIEMTRHKQLEQQVAQSQKMQAIGQLAGAVAHDFNNLLTAMIGFCDLLLLRHRAGDQSFADLMQIKQNANRAANLVRQLLAFSRQQTLRPTVLSVTDVLVELNHLLQRLIGERITLRIEHGSGLYPVKVDQGQLEQVIINLAVNARDAMAETGGRLDIRTSNTELAEDKPGHGETVPPGQYVRIDVRDTGCGIPAESLSRVFEPFFSTKEVGEGTGLGLATVYGIIKQTGGHIQVDSTVGEGTVFSIYLPRHRDTADQPEAREGEGEAAYDLTGMGTVLLVEDEDAVRSFSARALRKKGYTVLEAQSGEAALTTMRERGEPVDLLITDVVMPEMEGPALVARLREMQPDLRVIYISGYAQDSFRSSIDSTEGARFLPKPFTLKQLAGAVKDAMYDTA
ncbi:two-component system, cell cycle sensor histidine kinase and response regulator CckA [Limimonas halophila]|uniref:histidine kinase n=1 Tax=Limimonas halophila TaxID=1082479 RepID=A0A1G7Q7T9_9PROT|nr:PAS domain-containing sensor histidine kinase [Limimonas halophila]SDF94535.1 two-component system, cell cycle sensor histidine kinase and response regulator CckA [Limimonas halophila]